MRNRCETGPGTLFRVVLRSAGVGIIAALATLAFSAGADALLGGNVNWVLAVALAVAIGATWTVASFKRLKDRRRP